MNFFEQLKQITVILSKILGVIEDKSKISSPSIELGVEPFVNSEELSTLLSCAKYKINRLADQGFIPYYNDIDPLSKKQRKLFRVSEVIKIIEASRQNGHLLDETMDRQLDPIDEDFKPRC